MRSLKMLVVVGMTVALGAGLTACAPAYTGEGTVVSKEIDKDTHRSGGKYKRTTTTTDYEITVDIPNEDANRVIEVSKKKYETIQIGQKVTIEKSRIK